MNVFDDEVEAALAYDIVAKKHVPSCGHSNLDQ